MIEFLLLLNTIILIIILIFAIIKLQKKDNSELLHKLFEKTERSLKEDFARFRQENFEQAKTGRVEQAESLKSFNDTVLKQLWSLSKNNEERLDKMRETIEKQLHVLQEDNNKKLEQMRATVDEKLHETLEKRLGESFKIVSERLELVHKGLGEMKTLANGVGDLKKVLSNVKTRGVLGEYQLESILEQILTTSQYEKNVKTKQGSNAHVEFAIKFPGNSDSNNIVWLPIDSKFPTEDYTLLLNGYETGSPELIAELKKNLANKIKIAAKEIHEKYIDPPNTTDFAIMFLPIEGLYAEVISNPEVFEFVQRKFKIAITGPTTLSAFLNSLQMGFRTLAIEKRSSEVWNLLGAVKTEFGRFGDILDKTHKKLQEAGNTIENAARKSRTIERKLRDVQELPEQESLQLLSE
jgi:DNA recombination protein RmuC